MISVKEDPDSVLNKLQMHSRRPKDQSLYLPIFLLALSDVFTFFTSYAGKNHKNVYPE